MGILRAIVKGVLVQWKFMGYIFLLAAVLVAIYGIGKVIAEISVTFTLVMIFNMASLRLLLKKSGAEVPF